MHYQHAEARSSMLSSQLNGYRTIFAVTFLAFLSIALVGQVFAWNWRNWLPGAEGTQSMFDSVTSAVYTVISQLSQ